MHTHSLLHLVKEHLRRYFPICCGLGFSLQSKRGFSPLSLFFLEQKVFAAVSYGSNLVPAAWSQTMSINAFLNKHIQSTKPWCFTGCILFHFISFSTRTKSEQSAQPGTAKDLLHSNFFILLVAGWRWQEKLSEGRDAERLEPPAQHREQPLVRGRKKG